MLKWKKTSYLGYRMDISSSGSFHLNDMNDVVFARVNLCHMGEWPLGGHQNILLEEDNITNSNIPGALVPLVNLA